MGNTLNKDRWTEGKLAEGSDRGRVNTMGEGNLSILDKGSLSSSLGKQGCMKLGSKGRISIG